MNCPKCNEILPSIKDGNYDCYICNVCNIRFEYLYKYFVTITDYKLLIRLENDSFIFNRQVKFENHMEAYKYLLKYMKNRIFE